MRRSAVTRRKMTDEAYKDIIDLPRPISSRHRPMSRANRAAQFAPFAALTGYDACIDEEARLTGQRIELSEEQIQSLANKIAHLGRRLDDEPVVAITYFKCDPRKNGGEYLTVEGVVTEIDELDRTLILEDQTKIPMVDILAIESDLFSREMRQFTI